MDYNEEIINTMKLYKSDNDKKKPCIIYFGWNADVNESHIQRKEADLKFFPDDSRVNRLWQVDCLLLIHVQFKILAGKTQAQFSHTKWRS